VQLSDIPSLQLAFTPQSTLCIDKTTAQVLRLHQCDHVVLRGWCEESSTMWPTKQSSLVTSLINVYILLGDSQTDSQVTVHGEMSPVRVVMLIEMKPQCLWCR